MVIEQDQQPEVKKYDLSGIRYMICGAAPLSADLMTRLTKVLPNTQIGQGFGVSFLFCAVSR